MLEDVVKIIRVGKSTVRKWETREIDNMKLDKITLLAKVLKTSPTYLMDRIKISVVLKKKVIRKITTTSVKRIYEFINVVMNKVVFWEYLSVRVQLPKGNKPKKISSNTGKNFSLNSSPKRNKFLTFPPIYFCCSSFVVVSCAPLARKILVSKKATHINPNKTASGSRFIKNFDHFL